MSTLTPHILRDCTECIGQSVNECEAQTCKIKEQITFVSTFNDNSKFVKHWRNRTSWEYLWVFSFNEKMSTLAWRGILSTTLNSSAVKTSVIAHRIYRTMWPRESTILKFQHNISKIWHNISKFWLIIWWVKISSDKV